MNQIGPSLAWCGSPPPPWKDLSLLRHPGWESLPSGLGTGSVARVGGSRIALGAAGGSRHLRCICHMCPLHSGKGACAWGLQSFFLFALSGFIVMLPGCGIELRVVVLIFKALGGCPENLQAYLERQGEDRGLLLWCSGFSPRYKAQLSRRRVLFMAGPRLERSSHQDYHSPPHLCASR